MTGWIVRAAQGEDADQMTDVVFRSKASNGYVSTFMEACREELRVTPDGLKHGYHWIADRDGAILGTVSLIPISPERAEIRALFFAPDAQGKGVGKALWQVAMATAQALSLEHIRLDADPEAVAFYESMGCKTIGLVPSGSIAGRMLPLMEFTL